MARELPRRALITGATAGIGRATAELFAREGVEVGILAERPAEVEETVAALLAAGGRAFPIHANLLRPEEVTGLIDRLEGEGRGLDLLVNNAGIGLQADVLDTGEEDFRRVFQINFFSMAVLSRDALRHMASRGRGQIINVSSAAARRGLPGMAAYAASKAAMHGFSQSLRIEAAQLGVTVCEVLPMSVRTRFFEEATNRAARPYRPGWRTETPESLARRILRLVRRPVPELYSPGISRVVFALDALDPRPLDAIILARRRRNLTERLEER
jgi:short-subunit dehydrogenase